MILRAFLQPFFFALGMASALHKTISPQHQKQESSTKPAKPLDTENEFVPNSFIDKDPSTTIGTPITEGELSTNNGAIETILLGPGQ